MVITVFWGVMPCNWGDRCQCVGGMCFIHLQHRIPPSCWFLCTKSYDIISQRTLTFTHLHYNLKSACSVMIKTLLLHYINKVLWVIGASLEKMEYTWLLIMLWTWYIGSVISFLFDTYKVSKLWHLFVELHYLYADHVVNYGCWRCGW